MVNSACCLSLSPTLSFLQFNQLSFFCLSVSLSVQFSLSFVCLSLSLSSYFRLFTHFSISFSLGFTFSLSICLFANLFQFDCLSLCLIIFQSVFLSPEICTHDAHQFNFAFFIIYVRPDIPHFYSLSQGSVHNSILLLQSKYSFETFY